MLFQVSSELDSVVVKFVHVPVVSCCLRMSLMPRAVTIRLLCVFLLRCYTHVAVLSTSTSPFSMLRRSAMLIRKAMCDCHEACADLCPFSPSTHYQGHFKVTGIKWQKLQTGYNSMDKATRIVSVKRRATTSWTASVQLGILVGYLPKGIPSIGALILAV